MTYLLDTNTWIVYLRKKNPLVQQRLHQQLPADLALCAVVLGELLYGVHHSPPTQQSANMAAVVSLRQRFVSLPFDDDSAEVYAEVRAHLASLGTPIGPNDLMIAAIAKANGLILVSNNTSEFSRVPGLSLEDWQKP